mmetsp:Transcript_142870/g.456369  ORF Transcript_142870/g.456369 Transcript_142870/m.456369 type:complete len:82 (+) Transcript_142870:132-377(+)
MSTSAAPGTSLITDESRQPTQHERTVECPRPSAGSTGGRSLMEVVGEASVASDVKFGKERRHELPGKKPEGDAARYSPGGD